MGLGTSLLTTLPIAGGSGGLVELFMLGSAALGAFGVVGASILDRLLDTDSENGDEDALAGDAGGGGFGDMGGMGDDMGGMGGMGDDMGGMGDDMGGMDDDMGGFGGDMGGFDDGGNAGGDVQELEHQLGELENEVASLSSTVSTVRSENTEISERIEDVEEDVRNLLDIYEMVTRGINPFVDEGAGDLDLGGESLGLFDDGSTEADAGGNDVDESVMNADAEGFFDDEFEEDDAIEDDTEDETESEAMVSDQSSSGGKSFSELKEEYDSGEADWADDGEGAGDESFEEFDDVDDGFDDDIDDEFGGSLDEELEDSTPDGQIEATETDEMENGHDELAPIAPESSEPGAEERSASGAVDEQPASDSADEDGFEFVRADQLASGSEKPYLTRLPGDYVGDLIVMEWLEYLVDESDVTDAARAVNYYERIEWIGPDVAEQLRSFLSGFGDIDRNRVDRPGTDTLTRNHHIKSLKYVMQLNGTTATSVILDRWDMLSKGRDGSHR